MENNEDEILQSIDRIKITFDENDQTIWRNQAATECKHIPH